MNELDDTNDTKSLNIFLQARKNMPNFSVIVLSLIWIVIHWVVITNKSHTPNNLSLL